MQTFVHFYQGVKLLRVEELPDRVPRKVAQSKPQGH